ncbi:hypothetical protein [Streptomyces sp. NBC_01619]|nr:hypothetical protein [Streptomyces sp. NBC_01619]
MGLTPEEIRTAQDLLRRLTANATRRPADATRRPAGAEPSGTAS